jgi:hypothetical protein
MKLMFLTLIAILGIASVTVAQKPETLILKRGQQKSAAKGDVILRFLSVIEDSRCPTDVNCVWAGNAKIEVLITDKRGGTKKAVMNTTRGPLGDQHNGYAIYLTSLTPTPKSGKTIKKQSYVATFNVTRLFR